MKIITLLTSIFFTVSLSVGSISAQSYSIFSLDGEDSNIQFIKLDPNIQTRKPVIIFCQDPSPRPLVVKNGNETKIPTLDNFRYQDLLNKYHIVVIAMPNTPIEADVKELTSEMKWVPDITNPEKTDSAYYHCNMLETYVQRGQKVIEYLRRQLWVDRNNVLLVGHSQGACVALAIAQANENIKAVGYLNGNVMGRFATLIARQRDAAKAGRISHEQAQSNIQQLHEQWERICNGENLGNSTATWKSFSNSDIEKIISLKTPLFVAYGTEDSGAVMCDMLPVYMRMAGKKNYQIESFAQRGHNFEFVAADGTTEPNNNEWQAVMDRFIYWYEKL